MPHDDPDPQDPMVLVGVELPGTADADREMAWALAEEFARLGFDRGQILALFHEPFYAAAHGALARLGEEEVGVIVGETLAVWGRARAVVRDPAPLIQIAGSSDSSGCGHPAGGPRRVESHVAPTCEGSWPPTEACGGGSRVANGAQRVEGCMAETGEGSGDE